MPTYLAFEKVHFKLASKFSTVYQIVLKNEKAIFKVALRKFLNTDSLTL
jgi:hypothetical protein